MDKKKIIIALLIIIALGVVIYVLHPSKQGGTKPNDDKNEPQNKELVHLKELIQKSGYFNESKITWNEEEVTLTIDEDYVINVYDGFYSMPVNKGINDSVYCEIVDAVEISLGLDKGASIETCEETLKGKISLGGINYEVVNGKGYLAVNSNELSNLYKISKTYSSGEVISISGDKYNVSFDSKLFTNMSYGIDEVDNSFSICGHVYSNTTGDKSYTFKIYDIDKNILGEEVYSYNNDNSTYKTFCVTFDVNGQNVKYYSID